MNFTRSTSPQNIFHKTSGKLRVSILAAIFLFSFSYLSAKEDTASQLKAIEKRLAALEQENAKLKERISELEKGGAQEIAKQLRLRDIGGIIVIDFVDMEIRENRAKVVAEFRDALARDKTRTQVFDISDLGLVEMTRKRIGEGLLTEFSEICPDCEGRGVQIDHTLLD